MTTPNPVPQWAVDVRQIITDQINRHVAMTDTHRAWLADDIATRIEDIIARHAPDDQDRRRLDWLEAKMAGVWHNDRSAKFVVQAHDQVCGNIGGGYTIRAAIDAAMREGGK